MDLKKEILNYLDSIKNEFNELKIESRKDNIDNQLKHIEKYLPEIEAGKVSIEDALELFFGHLKIEPITTLKHVTLFDFGGIWSIKRKYNVKHWSDVLRLHKDEYSKQEAIVKTEEINSIYSKDYTEIKELSVPTGKFVFANYFIDTDSEYAFSIPNDLRFDEEYSINNKYGRQNCMSYLSKHLGLGYVQLGNTTASIFKISDDKLIIAPEYHYDDTTDEEIEPPKKWEYLGNISCSVWRVEFTDKINIDNHDSFNHKRLEEENSVTTNVNPGTWSVRSYYQSNSDNELTKMFGYPVWVELNKE